MTLPIAPFASTTEALSNDIKNAISVAYAKMPLFAWTVTYIIYKIYNTYIRVYFFFFQVTQPGIEPGHLCTLYPDNVIRNTIGHVGHPIYVINEVLLIYHSLLTLHMYGIYKIYHMHIRYIQYILHIRYIIHI